MEEAVKKGRKAWACWKLFREFKYRANDTPIREQLVLRATMGYEKRLADAFQNEFHEDPVEILARVLADKVDQIRR